MISETAVGKAPTPELPSEYGLELNGANASDLAVNENTDVGRSFRTELSGLQEASAGCAADLPGNWRDQKFPSSIVIPLISSLRSRPYSGALRRLCFSFFRQAKA